jgi:acyl phosphate:glycerol-3-phosphate acyltransferase
MAMLGGLAVFLVVFVTTRYVSLASMLAGVGVVVTLLVQMSLAGVWDVVLLGFGVLVMLLVILRHRANIRRIMAGTEPKAGRKK